MSNPIIRTEDVIDCISLYTDIHKDGISLESDMINDLGYDSLTLFELVDKLEIMYRIRIDERDFSKLLTVGDIVSFLKERA